MTPSSGRASIGRPADRIARRSFRTSISPPITLLAFYFFYVFLGICFLRISGDLMWFVYTRAFAETKPMKAQAASSLCSSVSKPFWRVLCKGFSLGIHTLLTTLQEENTRGSWSNSKLLSLSSFCLLPLLQKPKKKTPQGPKTKKNRNSLSHPKPAFTNAILRLFSHGYRRSRFWATAAASFDFQRSSGGCSCGILVDWDGFWVVFRWFSMVFVQVLGVLQLLVSSWLVGTFGLYKA